MDVLSGPLLVVDPVTPAAFWGMAALSAPILVHLLFRHKPTVVKFPALRFLLASRRQTARRFRLKQLLLLLLRLAVIAGFVAALAELRLVEDRPGASGSTRRVNAVLIIDNSYSMGHVGPDDSSRLDRAKALALQLIELFSPDSRLALVFCSDRADVALGAFTFDREAIREKINSSRLTHRTTDCGAALTEAYRLFRTEEIAEARAIFLLTDCTANAWRTPTQADSPQAKSTPLYVIDVGDEALNRYVALPEPDLPTAAVGVPFPLSARVALPRGIESATVELTIGGKLRGAKTIRADGPGTCEFTPLPGHGADLAGSVGLRGSDPLEADNRAWFAIQCAAQRKVLLVDGQTTRGPGEPDVFFLTNILAPAVPGTTWPTECELIVPGGLDADAVEGKHAVVLVDVPRLEKAQWQALADYVADGGALIVFAGPQLDAGSYTPDAQDADDPRRVLFPCRFGGVSKGAKPFAFALSSFAHPFLRPFETDNPHLDEPRFQACIEATPSGRKGSGVILKFTNGLPALLEQAHGHGRVLVFTSTAGRRWGNLPQTPHAYAPFVHELIRYGAQTQPRPPWVHVGDPVSLAAPSGRRLRAARVRAPDADTWETIVLPLDERGRRPKSVALPSTERAGIYKAELTTDKETTTHLVAVNVDTWESASERIEPEDLARLVPGNVRVVHDVRDLRDLLEVGGSVTDLNRYLLPLLFVLLLAELLLANHMYARGGPDSGEPAPPPSEADAPPERLPGLGPAEGRSPAASEIRDADLIE